MLSFKTHHSTQPIPTFRNQSIIARSRDRAIRAVDHARVLMYWHIGERIVGEEKQGKERANYGQHLIRSLAEKLEPEYGSSFSKRQLDLMRQFYRTFPIVNTLRSQLSWTHYRLLIWLENEDKRAFYIAEATKNSWTTRHWNGRLSTL
ncbi:MAG: DUF1016 N-terminal domain-containing protein [Bacteroidota bacterium]